LVEDTRDDETHAELLLRFLSGHLMPPCWLAASTTLEPPARAFGAPAGGTRKPWPLLLAGDSTPIRSTTHPKRGCHEGEPSQARPRIPKWVCCRTSFPPFSFIRQDLTLAFR